MREGGRSKQSAAVVTGAGSGIGRAFALELARRNGRVVCADINAAAVQATVHAIQSAGGQATAVVADVASLDDVMRLAAAAEEWLQGPADLLINNAGVGVGGKQIGEIGIDDWRWALSINLWGVIHGCHVFVPKMRAQGRGSIINVCSSASFGAAPRMGPYNVSKAAALALSETLAAELSGSGIHVVALCPTWVKTNILDAGRITSTADAAARHLIKRGMSAENVVTATLSALDQEQFYVLPQADAKLTWHLKRLLPDSYRNGLGLLERLAQWREA